MEVKNHIQEKKEVLLLKNNMGIRNFGIGLGLSPYKQEEEDKKKDDKPKKEVKEYGGSAKQPDKGWVKALKAGVTMLSHGLASVYGGTAHTPKINWGKRKKEKEALPDGEDLMTNIENKTDIDKGKDNTEMNFASQAEGNEFRAWVNKTYPKEAREMDLDPAGSHTNSYIKEAWKRFGKEFNETKSPATMKSPLNKGKRGQRGTATRGKSTATRKRRGGFTKGGKKAGDRNMGQYNVQTRFSPRAAQPIKGGVTSSGGGGGGAPYSYDKMGNMVFSPTINNIIGDKSEAKADANVNVQTDPNYMWVPPEYGTRTITKKLPTYRESWDKNMKNVQSKYKTFEEYKAAAIAWNKKHGGGSKTSTETYLIKPGYYVQTGSGTNISASASATAKS